MDKLALERAEEGEWAELMDFAENIPHSIMVTDEFGMLPLHWVCTERKVPLEVLQCLLRVYPDACECKNNSGMLPLHVAITSKLPGVHLNALVEACPDSIYVKGGDGLYPAEMARRQRLPDHCVNVLKKLHSLPSSSTSIYSSRPSISSVDSSPSLRLPRSSSWESVDRLLSTKPASLSSGASTYSASSSPKSISSRLTSADLDEDIITAELRDLSLRLAALQSPPPSIPTSTSVLWNPGDRLGVSLEPIDDTPHHVVGARVKRFTGPSDALGIDAVRVGDQLMAVNGIDVSTSAFSTVCRFLKKANVTCTLTFASHDGAASSVAAPPPRLVSSASFQPDSVHDLLESTLQKVQSVHEMVRLSAILRAA
ncbi:Aste57867_24114 [Aphanomyces stellatus]|uniref:Aste57867_24114 protein n=1 Tax=Aphanomyces stellatus TaxID=120398 RepID=A0A485LPF3_9STRA|nr:hypothetical protein As57867_024040 [Aphanomyces stellatus]VFU00756.1 Aste57867_24114 [Aphanomyces stellatus]